MSSPEPLNPKNPNARRPARRFTPRTPFHHPNLDPDVPKEDFHLIPSALFAGRKLNRQLPRPAVVNLHVMLKLTDDPDELQNEFHDKVPQVNEVLGLWGEMKGANSTTTGEAKLRSRACTAEDRGWTSTDRSKGTTFNLVSNLDTPGRADVIYLANASADNWKDAEDSSIPSNIKNMEWLGFDGSYVHVEDAEPKVTAAPTEQGLNLERRESTPPNLRVNEWLNDEQYTDFASETYVSEPGPESDAGVNSKEIGP